MIRISSFNAGASPDLLQRYIATHSFNTSLSVAIVNSGDLELPGQEVFEFNWSIVDFLSPAFLNFTKEYPDSVVIGMREADLRTSPWLMAIASDRLILNMSRNTYQGFGLEGKSTDKTKARYDVCLDLKDQMLLDQDSWYYTRVVDCFGRLPPALEHGFTASFACQRAAEAFQTIVNVTQRRTVFWKTSHLESILVPPFPDASALHLSKEDECQEIVDLDIWAGLLFNGATRIISTGQSPLDPFICGHSFDLSVYQTGSVEMITLPCSSHVATVLEVVKHLLANASSPLVCVRCFGDPNAPRTWAGNYNSTDIHNDSSHGWTLFLQPSTGNCLLLKYSAVNLSKQ